jgi:hypothetical protein
MKLIALFAATLAVAGPASADQIIVGGTQSTEGFPFYGC